MGGTFDLNLSFNYAKNAITRIAPLPEILEGTPTIYTSLLDVVTINAVEKNRPDRRTTFTALYSRGRLSAMARAMEYGRFVDGSLDGLETFGGKVIFDAELGYRFDQIKLALGMRNLLNTYPDEVTVAANTNNGTFIYPGASPFGYNGRFVYVRSEILLGR
jgi:iron complex outermembrane receptor protein